MAETDEQSSIEDPTDAAWLGSQRQLVTEYLGSQRCEHGGVSSEPRWFMSPYVGIWAVRSRTHPDRVGWWAISGDLPTDYMSATGQRSSGDVLIAFADHWEAAAEAMRAGRQLPGFSIGNPSHAVQLAPLLDSRADLIREFGEQLNESERA